MPKPPMRGKAWTAAELKELRRLYVDTDMSVRSIAAKLERPVESARDRVKRMVKAGEVEARPSPRKQPKPKPVSSTNDPDLLSGEHPEGQAKEKGKGKKKPISKTGRRTVVFLDLPAFIELKACAAAEQVNMSVMASRMILFYAERNPYR